VSDKQSHKVSLTPTSLYLFETNHLLTLKYTIEIVCNEFYTITKRHRERTSITLSVLEPSQTPTPLCYQGVIFSHTPPSPLPWLRNTWIMSSIKQIFRKGLLLHNKSLWTECISRNQCYNHPQPKDFWATLLQDHNLWLTDCLFPCLSGEKCCD